MIKYNLLLAIMMIILISCGSNEDVKEHDNKNVESSLGDGFTKYDLSEYEIPVVVDAPVGAQINAGVGNGAFGGVRTINYEIVKGNFIMDVNHIIGAKYSKENLISSEKLFAEEIPEFVGFVLEEENGFIFKMKTDEGDDYGFYYLLLKNEQAIEFGVGFSYSNFTLEQVQMMYKVAKNAN